MIGIIMKLCDYGCGREAKFSFKNGLNCCSSNTSSCPEIQHQMSIKAKQKYPTIEKPLTPCEKCGKIPLVYYGTGRFCCQSCANSKVHSQETKAKIGKGVVDHLILNNKNIRVKKENEEYEYKKNRCPVCNKEISRGSKHCVDHMDHNSSGNNGGLYYTKYERLLKPILEEEYGPLGRVLINNRAFDFSNSEYIIEFTFDFGAGTSSAINAFQKLKEFHFLIFS